VGEEEELGERKVLFELAEAALEHGEEHGEGYVEEETDEQDAELGRVVGGKLALTLTRGAAGVTVGVPLEVLTLIRGSAGLASPV